MHWLCPRLSSCREPRSTPTRQARGVRAQEEERVKHVGAWSVERLLQIYRTGEMTCHVRVWGGWVGRSVRAPVEGVGSNGHLYARPVDRWGRDSRLRLEILADLSHGHAQVSPVDPSSPVPHSRLKIED